MVDLMLDDVVDLLEEVIRRILAVLDQVEKVVTVASIVVGGRADRQEVQLHAVPKVVPAPDLDAISDPLAPGLGLLQESVVGPERRLDGHALVAEETLQIRL